MAGKMKKKYVASCPPGRIAHVAVLGMEKDASVRKSLDEGINRINKAVNIISGTKGYELMTLTDMTKSG
jgi:hypothetical protein